MEERTGYCETLAHASRKLPHQAIADPFESGPLEPCVRSFPRIVEVVQPCEQHQILGCGQLIVE